ncbi:MAG: insulinase family protein [Chloroflexi bacterium]|nr:MAG: insulinase family protein [Chloroflexota bacterium]
MQTVHVLDGGLRVVIESLPHTHSVSICCIIAVGSGHETTTQSGMAHFIEHMLFKGTPRRPTPKILIETIEGVGGMIDAYTNIESTVYSVKVADIHQARAIDVLADMVLNPNFTAADVEKERKVIIEEISQTADSPAELVHLLFDAHLWGDQPLGRDIAGSEATVASFARDALVEFWRQHYVRSNLIISVAGNVNPVAILAMIDEAFAPMPVAPVATLIATLPFHAGPQLHVHRDDSEQVNFCLGVPGLAVSDPDRRAMLVFDAIVGGNSTSRLFQEIREERALAYMIGSYSREYADAGKWVVSASVDVDAIDETISAVMQVLRTVRHEGITAAELAQIKEQVKGGILLSLEDSMAVASRNGSHLLRYGRIIPLADVVSEVEVLQLGDVMRVAERILRPEGLHLALIGPVKKITGLQKELHFSA